MYIIGIYIKSKKNKYINTHINTTMLHQDDLIFCKTESGVTSCGYNISNMLLNALRLIMLDVSIRQDH